MGMSREERSKALKKRMQDAAKNRGKKGLGRKGILDVSLLGKGEDEKINFYSPDTGKGKKNLIDIIPFTVSKDWYPRLRTFSGKPTGIEPGEMDYKLEVPVHRNVGPNDDTYLCLSEAFGDPCSICEDRRAEQQKGDDADEEKIKSLYAKWRTIYCIWDYNDEDKDLQLFDVSYHLFEKLVMEEADLGEEGVIIHSDLDEGKSIEFKAKEKTYVKAKYFEAQSIEFKDRDPIEDDFQADAFPIDTLLVIPTYEQVEQAYYGVTEDEEGSDTKAEKEDKPKRHRAKHKEEPEDKEPEDKEPEDKEPEDKEPEDEEPGEEEPGEEGECPSGGDFGTDCNELDECAECPNDTFEACAAKQDSQREEKREGKKDKPKKEDKPKSSKEDKPKRSRGGKTEDKKEDKPKKRTRNRG